VPAGAEVILRWQAGRGKARDHTQTSTGQTFNVVHEGSCCPAIGFWVQQPLFVPRDRREVLGTRQGSGL
jgi:hypothetical protein